MSATQPRRSHGYRISWPRGAYLTTLPLPISELLAYNPKKTSWLSSGYRHGLAIATLFLEPLQAHARGPGLSLDYFSKPYIPKKNHFKTFSGSWVI